MAYILDTNVAIHFRDGDPRITANIADLGEGLLISVLTRVELEGGVQRSPAEARVRRRLLDAMLLGLTVLPFDDACANGYRSILETVGYSRRKVMDRMIAAQAIVHRAALVTCNRADFRDVPNLHLVEW